MFVDHQKTQSTHKTQKMLTPKQPLNKLFDHTPAGQLNKIQQLSFFLGDAVDTNKRKNYRKPVYIFYFFCQSIV